MHRGLNERVLGARALAATMACALLTLLAATPASAGDLAVRLPGDRRLHRPREPDRGPVRARRPRLRRREERPHQDLRRARRRRPRPFADLRTNVHNYWDRGLLGLALDPDFANDPYVYVLYTLDAAIGGTAPRWGTPGSLADACPTPPGADDDGCVVSGRLSRSPQPGGDVATASRCWSRTGASSSRATRSARSRSAPTARSTRAAATARASTSPTTGQDGQPASNPCGDPPGGVGGNADAADRRGRRAAQRRTSAPPATRSASTARSCASTRPPAPRCPDNPLVGSADAERPAHHRLRPAQPVPLHVPAGHQRDLDRRRRLEHLGGDQPRRRPDRRQRRATSAGPATRARPAAGLRRGEPRRSARPLRRRPDAVTAPYFTYNH